MSDPYRSPPVRSFRDNGIFVTLDQVAAVVKYKMGRGSAIKIFLRTGQEVHVEWPDAVNEASAVFTRLSDAMESIPI
jgi:hypothetical protein